MKTLTFMTLLVMCCMASYAQTLKVTDVSSENEKLYSSVSKRNLGKNLILEIYDKAAKVTLANEKPLIMKQVSNGLYHTVVEDRQTEVMTADLTVDKILGVVSTAKFKITISETGGKHRTASYVVTGKRY